jgi:cytochrome c-type biogenesis protein CcmF
MIIEIGHFALILALATAVVQSVVPLIGARRRDAGMMAVGPLAAVTSLMLVAISFFALTHAYVVSDFSVQNVVENSHSLKPMLYKITGVWGNHEGSMLLVDPHSGAVSPRLVALFGRNLPDTLKANVLGGSGLDHGCIPAVCRASDLEPVPSASIPAPAGRQ